MVALAKPDNIIAMPQKSNEWYTPAQYVEAAREVMGDIDLDPASCAMANQTVKATHYYTKEDNGLSKPWYGRVWLNPPYALDRKANGLYKSSIEVFSTRLLHEYQICNVSEAILLVMATINSQWFNAMWNYPICFADHIVKFSGKKTNPKTPLMHRQGTVFVYLGPNEQRFIDIFSQFGTIAKRVSTPKVQSVNIPLWEVQP